MAARTDAHRPSAINPDDYTFVAYDYHGPDVGMVMAMRAERDRRIAHMERTGGRWSNHEHGGSCHVCGTSRVHYAAVFYHGPSNTYLVTGEDCANKMGFGLDADGMSAFRSKIRDAREAIAGKRKAAALLEDKGLSRCWELYVSESRDGFQSEERTICDIVDKLVRYGSISDKAESYLHILLEKVVARPEREAARAAEDAAAAPCPFGRVTITGTIVTIKVEESDYGSSVRMLVRDDTGFRVWGSHPSSLGTAGRGSRVRFTATVVASEKDPKFGFFKRPAKGEVLEEGVA